MVCSNNDSILHRFRDITTFTVYVTGCDIGMSFVFEKIVEITRALSDSRSYIYDRPLTEINVIASFCALNLRIKFYRFEAAAFTNKRN